MAARSESGPILSQNGYNGVQVVPGITPKPVHMKTEHLQEMSNEPTYGLNPDNADA